MDCEVIEPIDMEQQDQKAANRSEIQQNHTLLTFKSLN